ncbi:proline-rich protein 2-like [Echeneis naucrates]|uniref:proline-rich protein 2-like n=1 Tax=Echeneis naucrates TaxID=173247 RepID=UPI0011140AA9|nr:proline-rich protein 2-like [Echeneis naucrates]
MPTQHPPTLHSPPITHTSDPTHHPPEEPHWLKRFTREPPWCPGRRIQAKCPKGEEPQGQRAMVPPTHTCQGDRGKRKSRNHQEEPTTLSTKERGSGQSWTNTGPQGPDKQAGTTHLRPRIAGRSGPSPQGTQQPPKHREPQATPKLHPIQRSAGKHGISNPLVGGGGWRAGGSPHRDKGTKGLQARWANPKQHELSPGAWSPPRQTSGQPPARALPQVRRLNQASRSPPQRPGPLAPDRSTDLTPNWRCRKMKPNNEQAGQPGPGGSMLAWKSGLHHNIHVNKMRQLIKNLCDID